jgi:hypothetical protein
MTDEQTEAICAAIKSALRFQNADIFEHVLGAHADEGSFVVGVHRIANALDRIADALGDEGQLERIADNLGDNGVFGTLERISENVDRVAEALEKKEE